MSEIDEEDAAWIREQFERLAGLVSKLAAEAQEQAAETGGSPHLDGIAATAFGSALAYVQVGSRLGVLDGEVGHAVLRQYLGMAPPDITTLDDLEP